LLEMLGQQAETMAGRRHRENGRLDSRLALN